MDNKIPPLSRNEESSLDAKEREDLREELARFARTHPPKKTPFIPFRKLAAVSAFLIRGILPRTLALACAFLLVSTGVAYASESALPGDFLYPLKVDVFEQIRGRFAFNHDERAAWESQRALRRLEEAEHLATQDELTPDVWVRLHGDFIFHVVEAEHHIEAMTREGNVQSARRLTDDLEAALGAHHSIITAIGHERRDTTQIRDVLNRVQAAQDDIVLRAYVPPTVAAEKEVQTKQDAEVRDVLDRVDLDIDFFRE